MHNHYNKKISLHNHRQIHLTRTNLNLNLGLTGLALAVRGLQGDNVRSR